MTRRIAVGGLGAAVAIELLPGDLAAEADDALAARLEALWARCRTTMEPTQTLTVRLGQPEPEISVVESDPERLATALTQRVTHALIGARRGELLMFHAGAVSHPVTGRSLVFIARGGTGKTTLSSTLARSYGYVTDETVGMQPDGTILPYPKPLSVRQDQHYKRETSPDELGLLRSHPAPHASRFVLLDRSPDAEAATIERLGTIDAIVAVSPETSSLSHLPRALHAIAELLDATGGAERWTYAEHADLLPLVHYTLGAP